MSHPTISACMIVKNEAESLERCLESVRPFVDEIIVVDTGSTDGTDRIAKKYTEKVYHHPWEDSFSKARNYSLSYATSDWILIIDADEELAFGDGEGLKETLVHVEPSVDHIFFTTRNLTREGGVMSECTNVRMFRNGRGIHYEGIVHNQVMVKGEGRFLPATLLHFGYALTQEKMEAKFKRTVSLTRKQIETDPENPFYHHNLCLSLVNHGDHKEAIEAGLKALELMKKEFPGNYPPAYYNLAHLVGSAALSSGQNLLAVSVCREALEHNPHHIDASWVLAMAYYGENRFEKSMEYGERYRKEIIKYRNQTTPSIPVNTIGQVAPLLATVGYSASHLGRHDLADSLFEESLNESDWAVDFGVKILHFCKEFHLLQIGAKILSGLMQRYGEEPQLQSFSQIFSIHPSTNLLKVFAGDPKLGPYLERASRKGNISLKEIRSRIEDAGNMNIEKTLLLTLEALQKEAQGDRSW